MGDDLLACSWGCRETRSEVARKIVQKWPLEAWARTGTRAIGADFRGEVHVEGPEPVKPTGSRPSKIVFPEKLAPATSISREAKP